MRESFGTAFVVNMVVIFVAIFIFFFVAGMSYTKAFKIKNRITDIIEENECFNEGSCTSKSEIEAVMKNTGYRIKQGNPNCGSVGRIKDMKSNLEILTTTNNTYRYCVYKVKTNNGDYYGAVAFMYFELPLGFGTMEFPVYGETKVMGEY